MLDIADEIDAAIGAPPPGGPAVDDALVLGRRALLRRRIAYGVGTAACTLVVAGAAWAVAPGGDSSAKDDLPIAEQSEPTETPTPAPSPAVEPIPLGDDLVASYSDDGKLVLKDGWRVTKRVDNPIGLEPPAASVGLEVTNGKKTYWYLLNRDGAGGSGASWDEAQKGMASFEVWVGLQAGANQPDPIADALDLQNGRLVSSDDAVEVVDQRVGVDLGAFGPAADTTVAELRWKGERWFVAALDNVRRGWELGAPINTPKAGTSLDSAIDYLRTQYDSGEGVR